MGGALERGQMCPRAGDVAAKGWRYLAAGAALVGAVLGGQAPALAISDNSAQTYAGEYAVTGTVPTGTFVAIEYLGYSHSDVFVTPNGQSVKNSNLDVFTDITRLVYFSELWGHPLVLEAALPMASIDGAKVGGESETTNSGVGDAVLFFSYYPTADVKNERWLGITNFFYIPVGGYDNTKTINVSTPNQFTWVPQIGYTEGLTKFGLKNLFFDFIANASIHNDGISPVAVGPLSYDRLTQDNSYDIKAFLRYQFAPATWVALGIEKSWGGEQIATGGTAEAFLGGPTVLGKDDWLRGHVQISMPLAQDFLVAADFQHDFEAEGTFKTDFAAQLRLTKVFLPEGPMK
jgi:hypothetical protein